MPLRGEAAGGPRCVLTIAVGFSPGASGRNARWPLPDLETEGGRCQDGVPGVHPLGFRREQSSAWLESAGILDVRLTTAVVRH